MSNEYENKIKLEVHDDGPAITTSGFAYGRGTKRGEQVLQPFNSMMASVEGNYGVISNTTPGTAIADQASITAYDATKLSLHVKNNETNKAVIVRYIKMTTAVVSGGSGTQKYEIRLDTQTGLTSGGTALTNRRTNLGVASLFGNVVATAGAMTTVAGSANEEKVYTGQMRNGVGLAGDVFVFTFLDELINPGAFLLPATTVGMQVCIPHGPLTIAPGGALRFARYGASLSTAAQFEWEIGVIVR
jgi:hypothetical protein